MKIRIVCVGKLKEKYWKDAVSEYLKRLGGYIRPEIVEVSDEKTDRHMSVAEEQTVKRTEGRRILAKIDDRDYVVALAIDGKRKSSEELATFLGQRMNAATGTLTFVIGGSVGLADDVLKRSNERLSFSDMTFPHQMMRVILLEQIYRGFKILRNEPYHK